MLESQAARPAPRMGSYRMALAISLLAASACDGRSEDPAEPLSGAHADPAQETTLVESAAKGPVLTFERTTLQLGTISDALEVRASFPFTNTGDAELVIEEIRKTCGCTTTELLRDRYAPGEGAQIEVVYRPQGQNLQRRTLTVLSNGGDPIDLHLEARIEPFLRFDPAFGIRLGEVDRGKEHRARARFACADPSARVLEVSTMNPELEVHLLEVVDGWQEVELVLRPDAPWGNFTSRLVVKVEGVPTEGAEPVLHIGRMLFNAMIFDQVRVDPSFVSVGLVEPDAAFRGQVDVLHRHGGTFELADVRIEDALPEGLTVRVEPISRPGSSPGTAGLRVIVEGQAGDAEGPISGTVVIRTDIEDEPDFRLPISGRIGKRPGR